MKISTRRAFAALVTVSVLKSPQTFAAPSSVGSMPRVVVAKNAPRVTRDNFVSLSWDLAPGHFFVQGNILSYSGYNYTMGGGGNEPIPIVPYTQGISNSQLNLLIEKINNSRFTSLAGSSCQSRGIGVFNEPLPGVFEEEAAILTISDKNNQDEKFTLRSVGKTAPKSYNDLKTFWIKFIEAKFPSPFEFNFNPVLPKAKIDNP